MALGQFYNTGTVAVTNGSTTVTGTGVIWSDVLVGDFLQVGPYVAIINSVNAGFNVITLAAPWAGTNASGAAYLILKMSWERYVVSITQVMLREFLLKMEDAGVIYAVTGSVPDPGIGKDGDYALKTNTAAWTLWLKVTGSWVVQGDVRPPPDATYLAKAGGTMTGPLLLNADPTVALHATTKQYTDAAIAIAAANGIQINGGMEVDQPNAGASIAIPGGLVTHQHLMDGWCLNKSPSATAAFTIQQVASVFPGYAKALKLTVTTAYTVAFADTCEFINLIEGYRIAKFSPGTAAAKIVTVSFCVKSSVAGPTSIYLTNFDVSSVVAGLFTITSANVAQYVSITLQLPTTGVWKTDNSIGMQLYIRPILGNQGYNVAATVGNTWEMTGVTILPGAQAPIAAQSPLIMRPYDQELLTCRRYWWCSNLDAPKGTAVGTLSGHTGTAAHLTYNTYKFTVPMRVVPSLSIWNNGVQNQLRGTLSGTLIPCAGPISNAYCGTESVNLIPVGATTPNIWVDLDMIADARL